jgi:hypothetical protein
MTIMSSLLNLRNKTPTFNFQKEGVVMLDLIEKIGQSEINQDIFSGDYNVSYQNKWGETVNVGVFTQSEEAKRTAERYSRGFDSLADEILEELNK